MFISDLQDEDLEIAIKVVIVGNGAVGKSSMIQRYCKGVFTKGYKKTIGVDFLEKQLRISGHDVRLMLWDTAGQEEFDAITKAYYRGAQACVVSFSTTDRASFDAVRKWKRKVEDECGGCSIPMVLVQNKIDLMHLSAVSSEEVDALAKECRMRLYRTSVKEDINICNVFQHLAENYVNQVRSALFSAASDGPGYYPSGGFDLISGPMSILQIGGGEAGSRGGSSGGSRRRRRRSSGLKQLRFRKASEASAEDDVDLGLGVRDDLDDDDRGEASCSSSASSDRSCGSEGGSVASPQPQRYASPQEYLSNPMFERLNTKRDRHWLMLMPEKSITLKPLSTMRKSSALGSNRNSHVKAPLMGGCKVL